MRLQSLRRSPIPGEQHGPSWNGDFPPQIKDLPNTEMFVQATQGCPQGRPCRPLDKLDRMSSFPLMFLKVHREDLSKLENS